MLQTSESTSYFPLIQTLVGGLLAILGGLIGSFFVNWLQRRYERENLASAFYGEISALLTIIEQRGYIEGIESDLSFIESTGEASVTYFKVTLNFFKIYEQNVNKIGLLKNPLPEKIVTFYTLMFAAVEDFKDMSNPDFDMTNLPQIKQQLEELLTISNKVVTLGKEILGMIKPN